MIEPREIRHDILPEIRDRWSPRAFDPDRPVSDGDLLALLEAARQAPSCMNEQPWRFLVARTEESRRKLVGVLAGRNPAWAKDAPVLLLVLAVQAFEETGKPNRWHLFDTGTAWGFLSLEAQRRGLVTHAMGGVRVDQARAAFAIPEDMSIVCAVAVGYYGDPARLEPDLREREHPSPREPLESLLFGGDPPSV